MNPQTCLVQRTRTAQEVKGKVVIGFGCGDDLAKESVKSTDLSLSQNKR